MSKKEKNDLELSFTDKVMTVIIRGRWWLLGIFLALVIAGVVLIVLSSVKSSSVKKANEEYLAIEEDFNSIKESSDADFSDVLTRLNEFITSSSAYSNLKAIYSRAYIYTTMNEYQNAYNDYETVYNKSGKDSYYKDLSLYGMAVTSEELGNSDEAKRLYQKIWDDFGKASAESSSSLFALLRFAIKDNDVDKMDEYARLIRDNYSYSDYAKASEQYIKEEPKTEESAENVTENVSETPSEVKSENAGEGSEN